MLDKISRDNKPYLLFDHNSNSTERSVREGFGLPDDELFVPYLPMTLSGRIWALSGEGKMFATFRPLRHRNRRNLNSGCACSVQFRQ